MQLAKQIVRKTPLYGPLRRWMDRRNAIRAVREWEAGGRPAPPPALIKQRTVREYAERFGLRTLVETGTHHGTMVEAMKRRFDRIYSIELSTELYEQARRRFANEGHIELIHGDSQVALAGVLERLTGPALFWLDAHYSGAETARGDRDTPILGELEHIFASADPGHVILIDDARCFGTDPAYPSLASVEELVKASASRAELRVRDDSLRITPG